MVGAAVPAFSQDNPLEPKEWTVPWERTRPRDPIQDKTGRVWFVGQTGNYIAYLNPQSGEFKQYSIDAGTNPHNIVVDNDNGVWYTGNRNNRLVRLIPETGELKTYPIPDSTVRDPHTMIFDKSGIAWFTAQGSQRIGRFDPKTGEFKLWRPSQQRSNPYGVVVDGNGVPYFILFGTNRIASVDPKTLEYKEFVMPDTLSRGRRLAVTSDNTLWFGDYRGFLGHLDPKTGKFEEFPLPSGRQAGPYAMTQDDQDRVWLVEANQQPNKLIAFDTKTKQWVANIEIPMNGAQRNTIRHMTFNRATRELWFGTDAGTIGRIKVPVEIKKLTP